MAGGNIILQWIWVLLCAVSADPSTADAVYEWDPNLAITVPADGLASDGARPSTDTVLTA